jgi:hypothetical protein
VHRCAPCEISSVAESIVLQALQFQEVCVCCKFTGGAGKKSLLNEVKSKKKSKAIPVTGREGP